MTYFSGITKLNLMQVTRTINNQKNQIKGHMEHLQLDLFSVSTSKEIKNLRRWISRLEKRITEMELRQELIQHAKKTGFTFKESDQLRLFESVG